MKRNYVFFEVLMKSSTCLYYWKCEAFTHLPDARVTFHYYTYYTTKPLKFATKIIRQCTVLTQSQNFRIRSASELLNVAPVPYNWSAKSQQYVHLLCTRKNLAPLKKLKRISLGIILRHHCEHSLRYRPRYRIIDIS